MKEEKVKVEILLEIRKKLIEHNHPEWIIQTEYIADILKDMWGIIGKNGSILQIGCGCGYVLDALWEVGYRNLTGLDRNKIEIEDWNSKIKFIHSEIGTLVDYDGGPEAKEVLDTLPQYDVVFCHRFLHAWPRDKDWIFEKIAKVARKFLIIIETEKDSSTPFWDHIGRDYKEIFEKYGLKEVFNEENMFPVQNWEITTTMLRVFKK
jgi:2-polyprenyl-3-methyl-5-hydroxy-6-metoxy-1,4-benzoquinol methylase